MKVPTLVGAVALAASLAAPSSRAAEPVKLGKAEVQQLISGKTLRVEYVDPIDLDLAADGKFKSLATASGIRGTGT